jgi:peptidoglycan/LPS O-acetylase OafA/YrhL
MKQKLGIGKLRLVLALLVVFSHVRIEYFINLGWAPGSIGSYNSGSVAVVNFFAISGFVMAALWEKYYESGREVNRVKIIGIFYIDRLVRLFPQFFFYSVVALFCIQVLSIRSNHWQNVDIEVLIHNLTMLPLGFNMYLNPRTLLIPQAWSLGLELTFYAAVPFLLHKLNWKRIYLLAYLSMAIFLLPYFGLLNPFWYGYQLLPGIFFIFVIGISSNDSSIKRKKTYIILCRVFSGFLLAYLYINHELYEMQFNKEVLLGAFIATFLVPNFSNKSSRWDKWCGDLSYGVFLNHVILATLMGEYLPHFGSRRVGAVLLAASSITLSAFSFILVEQRSLVFRRKVRLLVQKQ